MDVTREEEQQMQTRLRTVLRAAEVKWLPDDFAFTETDDPVAAALSLRNALAIVRDGDRWSVLGIADHASLERFRVFSCHFDATIPNSGFVGWLASAIKRELGSGVFVICGHNPDRGGIFDYWGVPAAIAQDAVAVLDRLSAAS